MKSLTIPLISNEKPNDTVVSQTTTPSPPLLMPSSFTICCCAPDIMLPSITLSLADAAFTGTQWGPIVFDRPIQVHAISTTPLVPESVRQSMSRNEQANGAGWYQSVCPTNVDEVSLLEPLGLAHFRRLVLRKQKEAASPPKLLLVEIRMPRHAIQEGKYGLARLVDELSDISSFVTVVVSGGEPEWIANLVPRSELLMVASCKPDADSIMAFKVSAKPFGTLWLRDPDPTMISLLRSNTKPRWRQEPYLADDPLSRRLLRLRQSGETLEQIGKELNMDKSTVKRRLDKLNSYK
jgi:DNA-binding NarL/FixJ family response regulator